MGYIERIGIFERFRQLIGGNPPRVQAAALPWRRKAGEIEVMLVTSRGTGRWILPKGWPERRETLSQTAAREAMEEAGIEGVTEDTELGRYHYGKETESGLRWRCEVAVIPLQVKQEAKHWREKKKRTRRWVPPQKAARMVDEPELADLLARFERKSAGAG